MLIAIADEAGDDDDARLRKRVGVIAGYLTIVAPLSMPPQASFRAIAWLLAIGLSAVSVANLLLLWRTHRFDRYVLVLIAGRWTVPTLSARAVLSLAMASLLLWWSLAGPVFLSTRRGGHVQGAPNGHPMTVRACGWMIAGHAQHHLDGLRQLGI